ncbi:metal-dependent hydrolase [Burkholderia pyrrocinia]|uniref:metal-dependent hydrolase n=1 Tax=Burkholderia pyrrocinia TaxID=60550 RepID=UPI0004FFAB77|nr:metal-dependent hydrolase [Burkholderia pyrrocinia]KFL54015.1 metal-dependent hydrolase [Burkholderia pyrrocinia]
MKFSVRRSRSPDAMRAAPPIPQRDLRFPLHDTIPRYWYRGWCHVTRFFDAFSIMFPLGERFFIDSVSHFRDRIPSDTPLGKDVSGFIHQEATHIREHRRYNDRLVAQGAPVDRLEALIRRRQQNSLSAMPAITRLALTACLEHFTAILADQLLRHPEMLDGADPQMAAIWRWHAIEETEHKAVAFDVLAAIEPRPLRRYLIRCGAMLAVSVYFVFDLTYFMYCLAAADRQRSNLREWARLQWWLFVHPGIFTRILPAWLLWFAPRFHPDRIDSCEVLQTARRALDERV